MLIDLNSVEAAAIMDGLEWRLDQAVKPMPETSDILERFEAAVKSPAPDARTLEAITQFNLVKFGEFMKSEYVKETHTTASLPKGITYQ